MELIITIRKTVADKEVARGVLVEVKSRQAEGEKITAQLIDRVE